MAENTEKKREPLLIAIISFITEWAAMLALVAMTVIVCFTVITRYFLSYTPSWSEQSSLLCMVWFGFLSIALGVRDNQHISITILDQALGEKGIRHLDVFKYIAILGFGAFMIKHGLVICKIGAMNKLPGLGGLTSAYMYAAVPACGVAMCIYALQQAYHTFRGGKN